MSPRISKAQYDAVCQENLSLHQERNLREDKLRAAVVGFHNMAAERDPLRAQKRQMLYQLITGTCPFCKHPRQFVALSRHIQNRHPERVRQMADYVLQLPLTTDGYEFR